MDIMVGGGGGQGSILSTTPGFPAEHHFIHIRHKLRLQRDRI